MEYIDVLVPELTTCPSFVVNNAVKNVVLTSPGLPNNLYAGNTGYEFKRGDNFLILSAGYFLPEKFCVYQHQNVSPQKTCVPAMQLIIAEKPVGATFFINEFGDDSRLNIMFPNYEISIGTFVDVSKYAITTSLFTLQYSFPDFDLPLISMIDVPAVLNGETFYAVPFLKVLHNFELN